MLIKKRWFKSLKASLLVAFSATALALGAVVVASNVNPSMVADASTNIHIPNDAGSSAVVDGIMFYNIPDLYDDNDGHGYIFGGMSDGQQVRSFPISYGDFIVPWMVTGYSTSVSGTSDYVWTPNGFRFDYDREGNFDWTGDYPFCFGVKRESGHAVVYMCGGFAPTSDLSFGFGWEWDGLVTVSVIDGRSWYRMSFDLDIPSMPSQFYFDVVHVLDCFEPYLATYIQLASNERAGGSSYYVGYQEGYRDGQTDGYASGYNVGRSEGDSAGYARGYDAGYLDGQSSVTSAGSAINSLFTSVVGVPFQVLGGLSTFTVWDTAIISIVLTFFMAGLAIAIIKKVFL